MVGAAGLIEGVGLAGSAVMVVIGVMIAIAPLACWSCLGRLIRINKDILTELKIMNSMSRNKGRNME